MASPLLLHELGPQHLMGRLLRLALLSVYTHIYLHDLCRAVLPS